MNDLVCLLLLAFLLLSFHMRFERLVLWNMYKHAPAHVALHFAFRFTGFGPAASP